MTLKELKEKVDLACSVERHPEDVMVVIDVKLPYATVGARPSSNVKYCGLGFDWEASQFRIAPEDTLLMAEKNEVLQ